MNYTDARRLVEAYVDAEYNAPAADNLPAARCAGRLQVFLAEALANPQLGEARIRDAIAGLRAQAAEAEESARKGRAA
jgi:hypothetical protein